MPQYLFCYLICTFFGRNSHCSTKPKVSAVGSQEDFIKNYFVAQSTELSFHKLFILQQKFRRMSDQSRYNPDWRPANAGKEFATKVVRGKPFVAPTTPIHAEKKEFSVDELFAGLKKYDRSILAQAITLIESSSAKHSEKASQLLNKCLPEVNNSIRIGISGVPGSGKSTFIEALGLYLIENGHRIAVLTIDPSSSVTKGSILGDKTRMEKLSKEENCFIRPSPSSGTLGGVTRKSRESIRICEAAGYDIILIETVGVGQNEITVRSMVDFFLLIQIAGAGDELQGIKKGVIEISDAIVVNKADGDNKSKTLLAKTEYNNALHYLQPATKGWKTEAYTCSSITGEGIAEMWSVIKKFESITKSNNYFWERRKEQSIEWTFSMIENSLKEAFYSNPLIKAKMQEVKNSVWKGEILPSTAAEVLLDIYNSSRQ